LDLGDLDTASGTQNALDLAEDGDCVKTTSALENALE